MSKTKFTKLILFKENECEAVEKYLEEKALEGWFLDDISCGIFTFKRCEPKKCKFTVDIFEQLRAGEYRQYCESVGWNYVTETSKYFVFYTEDEDITPIQTDEELVLQKVGKSMLGNIFFYILALYFIIPPVYHMFFNNEYGNDIYVNYYLFIILISIIFVICPILNIVRTSLWYFKFKKAMKSEEEVTYPSLKELKISINIFNLYISIFLVVILCLIVGLGDKEAYLYIGLVIMSIIIYSIKIIKIITA